MADSTTNKEEAQFQEMMDNLSVNLMYRNSAFQKLADPRRDIDEECGYPPTQDLSGGKYRSYFDREPIARRIIEIMPQECWSMVPKIAEGKKGEKEIKTAFEQAWIDISNNLRGQSWFKGNEGNPIWEHLQRIDVLSGIGHYGILLLGIDDGKNLNEPIDGFEDQTEEDFGDQVLQQSQTVPDSPASPPETRDTNNVRKLLYLRAFDESLVEIERFETNQTSSRYGFPVSYSITMNDLNSSPSEGIGLDTQTSSVHWSRVIHVVDNISSSEIFGDPRLQVCINRVMDLHKLYGGSAEGYWQAATPGLTFSTDANVDVDKDALVEAVEKYNNSLQKYLMAVGGKWETLAPSVSDPASQIERQLEAICIVLGCPKRVFMGSERGELSSAQDKTTWDERLIARRNKQVTPRIIIPFIDRLIQIGVLPAPIDKDGYQIVWPDLDDRSKQEKADWGNSITDVLVKYVQGNLVEMIDPEDFLVKLLSFDPTEAKDIIKKSADALKSLEPKNEDIKNKRPADKSNKGTKPKSKDVSR